MIWGGNFPHKGWILVSVEDLDEAFSACEACGNDIRYVHHISHPKHAGMGVGVECASKLTEDYSINRRPHRRAKYPEYYAHRWIPLAPGQDGELTQVGELYVKVKKLRKKWLVIFRRPNGAEELYYPPARSLPAAAHAGLVYLKSMLNNVR